MLSSESSPLWILIICKICKMNIKVTYDHIYTTANYVTEVFFSEI